MKTKQKIALAKIAYRFVRGARAVVGQSDRCIVTRNGNCFELDLAEGIDFAIYLGRYEPSTSKALTRLVRPGTTVLDIGANVGAHTLHMARLIGPEGRVFAFEPTTFAFHKLQRNLSLNPGLPERVTAVQCFVGSANADSAPAKIYSSWPLTGGKDFHQKHLGQPMPTDGLPTRSLDGLLAENGDVRISLVKLDVDGYECEVLAGAEKMLSRDRPVFVMEIAPYVLEEHGKSLRELFSYFIPLGYRFYDERDTAWRELGIDEITNSTRDGASINVIAKA
ncbi:FkbM family methyltransferase [Bradyrhizobium sp. OAE829]|uniref:FkbM family methyltransferase n=1 Tax=Bradyrhizobium sp. OAE829 TaxID=2663807 RepID=UPI00178AF443